MSENRRFISPKWQDLANHRLYSKSGTRLGLSPFNNIGAIGSPASESPPRQTGRQARGRQPHYEVNGKARLTGHAHFWVFFSILLHMCGLLKWNWNKIIWSTSTWNFVSVLFQFYFSFILHVRPALVPLQSTDQNKSHITAYMNLVRMAYCGLVAQYERTILEKERTPRHEIQSSNVGEWLH